MTSGRAVDVIHSIMYTNAGRPCMQARSSVILPVQSEACAMNLGPINADIHLIVGEGAAGGTGIRAGSPHECHEQRQ